MEGKMQFLLCMGWQRENFYMKNYSQPTLTRVFQYFYVILSDCEI